MDTKNETALFHVPKALDNHNLQSTNNYIAKLFIIHKWFNRSVKDIHWPKSIIYWISGILCTWECFTSVVIAFSSWNASERTEVVGATCPSWGNDELPDKWDHTVWLLLKTMCSTCSVLFVSLNSIWVLWSKVLNTNIGLPVAQQ